MQPYANLSGNSGVSAFDHGAGWIHVQFKEGHTYEYTTASVGHQHLAQMKRCATVGSGLSTYISTHPEVRNGFSHKLDE